MAVLYRTNAQSRVIEDALRREGVAYRIIGSVRFYERKEIKDTLAYLKLLINPDDDVSLRRVINVPTRGIGKGVMDALGRAGRARALGRAGPVAALALVAAERRARPRRVHGARGRLARVFRDLIVGLIGSRPARPASIAIGKVLDKSGLPSALREDRSEEAQSRVENLVELVSAAREYETREPEASLGSFVDRLSLLSDADEEEGAADARVR